MVTKPKTSAAKPKQENTKPRIFFLVRYSRLIKLGLIPSCQRGGEACKSLLIFTELGIKSDFVGTSQWRTGTCKFLGSLFRCYKGE
jgi:hypothetical protein